MAESYISSLDLIDLLRKSETEAKAATKPLYEYLRSQSESRSGLPILSSVSTGQHSSSFVQTGSSDLGQGGNLGRAYGVLSRDIKRVGTKLSLSIEDPENNKALADYLEVELENPAVTVNDFSNFPHS